MAPLIVSAALAPADFTILDGLRRAHYPPERNSVRAHVTLFHHLPPSLEAEIMARLRLETAAPAPPATLAGIIDLGGGVAFRIESPALEAIRARLAEAFGQVLIPQDRAPWRPHVTIQNKVGRADAQALGRRLSVGFARRPLAFAGLALWRYENGPWSLVRGFRFGSGHAFRPPG